MSWARYPQYRHSGLDWLGDIPKHWNLIPLKHVASLKGRLGWQGLRADEYTDAGPFLVTSEHFENDHIEWARCYHVSHERFAQAPEIQLHPGDLLMMKDGAAMGKLAYVDSLPGPACLNSHLLLFRPLQGAFINRFLYYILRTPAFETYMVRERTGTTFFGISQESIAAFPLAIAPIDEQRQIVAVLDSEVEKIDALIEEQRQLIELLKEKRQAVVSNAVTKGLNPDAPMKPSGIEWLGNVPAHWNVTRLGRVCSEINDINHEMPRAVQRGIPFLSAKDLLDDGTLNFTEDVKMISIEDFDRLSSKVCPRRDDIIYSRIGACFVLVQRESERGRVLLGTNDSAW